MLTIFEELVSVAISSRSNLRSTGLILTKRNKVPVRSFSVGSLFSCLVMRFLFPYLVCTRGLAAIKRVVNGHLDLPSLRIHSNWRPGWDVKFVFLDQAQAVRQEFGCVIHVEAKDTTRNARQCA